MGRHRGDTGWLTAFTVGLVVALATAAQAREEQPVLPGGNLFGEVEPFRGTLVPLYGVSGQRLSLVLRPWVGSDLQADVEVETPGGVPLDLTGLVRERLLRSRRNGDRLLIRLRRLRLTETGVYRIRITPREDTSGGFDLTASARAPRGGRGRVEIPADGVGSVPVEAAPGDQVTVIARGRGRPRFRPDFVRVVAPSGASRDLGDSGRTGPVEMDEVGIHRFEVVHPSAGSGTVSYRVILRRPRPDRTPVDIAVLQPAGDVSGVILVPGGGLRPASGGPGKSAATPRAGDGPAAVPELRVGQMVVHAPSVIGAASLTDALAEEVPGAAFRVLRSMNPGGPHLVEITHLAGLGQAPRDQARTRTVLAAAASAPGVTLVEPNLLRRPGKSVNDPELARQDGLDQIRIAEAWDLQDEAFQVVVAVLDTGKIEGHPDLDANLVPGFDFISDPANSLDGDGFDSDPTDAHGGLHGTWVAGIIGARTDNGIGVAGVTHGTRIQPIRVLGQFGGTDFDIAVAVRWAAGLPVSGVPANQTPARVINMSLGGPGSTQVMQDAVREVQEQREVAVIAAAGNSASSALHFPAGYDEVMAIASVNRNGLFAGYSNFGFWLSMAAPGGDFTATGRGVLTTSFDDALSTPLPTYQEVEGTSFASPHVAGVAALMFAVDPGLTAEEVRSALESTAFDAGPEGFDTDYGWGILDAREAVLAIIPAPPQLPPRLRVSPSALVFGPSTESLPLRLTNAGSGTIDVVSVDAAPDAVGQDWLHVTVNASEVPATIVVEVDQDDLPLGVHTGRITVQTSLGERVVPVQVVKSLARAINLVRVRLVDDSGLLVAQTSASILDGFRYEFEDVPLGRYQVHAYVDYDLDFVVDRVDEFLGVWPLIDTPGWLDLSRDIPERTSVNFGIQTLGSRFQSDGVAGGRVDGAVAARVLDARSGQPVGGADIVVGAGGFLGATDETGHGLVIGVFDGPQDVSIAAPGFETRTNVEVNAQFHGVRLLPTAPRPTVGVQYTVSGLAAEDVEVVVQVGRVRERVAHGGGGTAAGTLAVPTSSNAVPVLALAQRSGGVPTRVALGTVDLAGTAPSVSLAAVVPAERRSHTRSVAVPVGFPAAGTTASVSVEYEEIAGVWLPLGARDVALDESFDLEWVVAEGRGARPARMTVRVVSADGDVAVRRYAGTVDAITSPSVLTCAAAVVPTVADGATLTSGAVALGFDTPDDATVSIVRITEEDGTPVWRLVVPGQDPAAPVLPLLARGGLEAGRTYSWTVRSLVLPGFMANAYLNDDLGDDAEQWSESAPRVFHVE